MFKDTLKLDYNSAPIYVGQELIDEETDISLKITKILKVEVQGVIVLVDYEYKFVEY